MTNWWYLLKWYCMSWTIRKHVSARLVWRENVSLPFFQNQIKIEPNLFLRLNDCTVCVTKADKTGLCEMVSQRMRKRGRGRGNERERVRETESMRGKHRQFIPKMWPNNHKWHLNQACSQNAFEPFPHVFLKKIDTASATHLPSHFSHFLPGPPPLHTA